MKLCCQMVHKKKTIQRIKELVLKTTVSVSDPFQGFYNMTLLSSVDEINLSFR